jgi:hypothetical protein
MNPALKGISPPITVSQGNEIARQADGIGNDDKKNGWAIAIANFKKTHVVKDGKWVKRKTEEMEMNMEKDKNQTIPEEEIEMATEPETTEEVEMSTETEKEVEVEMAEEEKEKPEDDSKEKDEDSEEKEKPEKKFEFPKNMSLEEMSSFFAEDEDEEDIKMAKAELAKEDMSFANPSILMGGMFAKMRKMANKISAMAEKEKIYMQENDELKKFKADLEAKQKFFEVEKTIKELSEKVIIPDEAREEMMAEAEKYSLDSIEEWKTFCKSKAFDFSVKEKRDKSDDVVRVGMPFKEISTENKNSLWKAKQ